jgi:hypothetical protein
MILSSFGYLSRKPEARSWNRGPEAEAVSQLLSSGFWLLPSYFFILTAWT